MRRLVLVLALAACGGSRDPLIGAWSYVGLDEVYTFAADKTMTVVVSTSGAGGCTTTIDQAGTWQESGGSTLTLSSSSQTVATSGCASASMNMPAHPDPSFQPATSTFSYTILGNTLTLTSAAGKVSSFTRK